MGTLSNEWLSQVDYYSRPKTQKKKKKKGKKKRKKRRKRMCSNNKKCNEKKKRQFFNLAVQVACQSPCNKLRKCF
jgi:hypothetical protein